MEQHFVTGILKLNTSFPRLLGDIGNPDSLRGGVVFETVVDANPANVITGKPLPDPLVTAFVNGAHTLIHQRVDLITTSCGFLLPLQSTLIELSNIPVITSSLLLLPILQSMHGDQIGVLTFDADKLVEGQRQNHSQSDSQSDIQMPKAIEGLRISDSLRQTIAGDHASLDQEKALKEVLHCASQLLIRWPSTRALVLECTNLSPYKQALRQHTRLPVYDLIDAIHWQQSATDSRQHLSV